MSNWIDANKAEIARQSDVISKNLRDNFTNIQSAINDNQTQITNLTTPPAGNEVTNARDNFSVLRDRVRANGAIGTSIILTGGVVSINAVDPQKVDVTAGNGIVLASQDKGVGVEWTSQTSGTIAYTVANTRYDVVVVNSANTVSVVTGVESADPVLPSIAITQKPLWVLEIGTASLSLGWDAREQGAHYNLNGSLRWGWKIQEAVTAITNGTITIGRGEYYEEVDLSGKNNITLNYINGAKHYRYRDTSTCIKCVNSSGSESVNINVYNGEFNGNSKAGGLSNINFEYVNDFSIKNIISDGNSSSTAKGKDLTITNCSNFFLESPKIASKNIDKSDKVVLSTYEDRFIQSFVAQEGNDLNITGVNTPAITALSSSRIAFVDESNKDLRTYDFDGTNWSQTGNDLNITGTGAPAITSLSSSRIAFVDDGNKDLRTYDFDGTNWSQTGNDLNIATVGDPCITALSSSRIAFIDGGNDDLRVYDFDGTNWSQVGNDLNITTPQNPKITTLSTNRIAYFDRSNQDLRTYDFDGTNWSQTGNDLNINTGGLNGFITALTSSIISFIDATNDSLRVYDFDGTNWSQVGDELFITNGGGPMAALSSTKIAYIDAVDDDLRTYFATYFQVPPGLTVI